MKTFQLGIIFSDVIFTLKYWYLVCPRQYLTYLCTTMVSTQGTTVRVEFGDAATAADSAGAHTISRVFPHTYGQPLAHFLRATAKVPDAQIIH